MFEGDPSIKRISKLEYLILKLKAEAEEANRVATFDAFTSANSDLGETSFISLR